MSWDNVSDFWNEYEYKDIIEKIWNNYRLDTEEKKDLLQQYDDSKSILTVPYTIKKRWKKLKWQVVTDDQGITSLKILTEFPNDILIDIPVLKNDGSYNVLWTNFKPFIIKDFHGNIVNYSLKLTTATNNIDIVRSDGEMITVQYLLDYVKDGVLELWVEEYYVYNQIILETYAPLTGLEDTVYEVDKYSKLFFNMVKALWYIRVNGATIKNIKIGLYALFNLPISLVENSKILTWEPGHVKLDTGEEWNFNEEMSLIDKYPKPAPDSKIGYVVANGVSTEMYYQEIFTKGEVGDIESADPDISEQLDIEKVYTPKYLRTTYIREGDTIPKFTFLVDGLDVADYLMHPDWWLDYNYYLGAIDIEKYSTMYIGFNIDALEGKEKKIDILGRFLEDLVPEFVRYALNARSYYQDKLDIHDDDLKLRAQKPLEDKWAKFDGTYKFDGSIKFDNFGDSLKIVIAKMSETETMYTASMMGVAIELPKIEPKLDSRIY